MTEIDQLKQRVAELERAVVVLTNRVNGAPMFSWWGDHASQPGLPAEWTKPCAGHEYKYGEWEYQAMRNRAFTDSADE